MEPLFSSRSKKVQAFIFLNALILCFTGMVHAQSQDSKDQNAQKPIISEGKAANKNDAANEARIKEKKQRKQEPGKDTGNYKGAQPPQGGREGQGPEHHHD